MKILLTGATGFIGNALLKVLLNQGHRVRVLVRNRGCLQDSGEIERVHGDLTKPDTLNGVIDNIDTVIHGAAMLGKWGTDKSIIYGTNVNGTLNLFDRIKDRPITRFIYLSAGGVTGPLTEKNVDETYPCRPVTVYEKSKYLAEQRILELSSEYNIPSTIVRPTFTYGPGDPHKFGLFRAVKAGKFAFVGNGSSVNHPVFIDDLVNGIFMTLEKGKSGEVYIIGGERAVTKKELIFTIADTLGVKRPIVEIPYPVANIAAYGFEACGKIFNFEPILTRSRVMMMGDNFGYTIEKARRELGYNPEVNLEDGVRRTVDYYKKSGML